MDYHFKSFDHNLEINDVQEKINQIKSELKKVIVGQDSCIDLLIISLLTGGHSLLEGVPGIAKTMIAKLFAKTISANFSRIQFTPDLMPSDITGTNILNLKSNEFEFKKGPIFSNIILIDEINRAPAKAQAALFECMAEQQVTSEYEKFILKSPFLVLATQNPIEQEGTYRLPEAQLDRFLFKISMNYPSLEDEILILSSHNQRKSIKKEDLINAVISSDEVIEYQNITKQIFIHESLIEYIAKLINSTRNHSFLSLGASPRASLSIMDSSKAHAILCGRDFVIPDDIKFVAFPVLEHRIELNPEKEMEGFDVKNIIKQIIDSIEIPR